ncbi:acyl-CoA-like ligand-binding transcription factor [Nocardia sp. Marseille-Q1738]
MTGLREKKKQRTRKAIQEHALRLFGEQGYGNTTVKQIADAAEVSERTFFRYFPTKEDVVLWDDLDLSFAARFQAQPAASGSFEALRTALRDTFTELSPAERRHLRERIALMTSVPPLRAMLLDQLIDAGRVMATLVADRSGTTPEDPTVRASVGAIVGAGFAAVLAVQDNPQADFTTLLGETLSRLTVVTTCPATESHERATRSDQLDAHHHMAD